MPSAFKMLATKQAQAVYGEITNTKGAAVSVNLRDSDLVIDGLIIKDPVVLANVKSAIDSKRDPEGAVRSMLMLGAQVMSLSSNSAGAETIEASIGHAKQAIQEATLALDDSVKRQLTEVLSEDGQLVKNMQTVMSGFRGQIEELTAGEDSPLRTAMLKSLDENQKRIKEDVLAQITSQKSQIAALLDPLDPTSPLRSIVEKIETLGKSVDHLKENLSNEAAVAEIVEAGVFGGLDYEELAVKAVQNIASYAGDDCEPTGNVTGRIARSKMGDGVVDLKVGAQVYSRIVLEAKNKALSKLDWEKEAHGSKQNRAAIGFIGLCKHLSDMPNASRILILDSRSIVIAFDPERDDLQLLALVYQLVKLNTLSNAGSSEDIDLGEINNSLEAALKSLEKFDLITKNASAIRNSADAITKDANLVRNQISEELENAQNELMRSVRQNILSSNSEELEVE